MSEIKRVTLNTLEPQKSNDKFNVKKCARTVRISVILPESNEDKCPEYNYKDQLAAAKKRGLKGTKDTNHVENGLDPFADDDNDVRRIALEMEAKYGAGMNSDKKKKKGKKDDYADIGMGYDENDSFIDNTDGYDEIIPENVTTLHGGFYINCGALEFKTDEEASSQVTSSSSDTSSSDSESNDEQDPQSSKIKKKRALESSDENDSDTAKKDPSNAIKKQKISAKNSIQHAIQKKLFSQEKIKVKKRRASDPNKKIKELIKEKREDLNMSVPSEVNKTLEENNAEKDSLKENKKPMNITSVTDAIESVVKQVVEENSNVNNDNQSNNRDVIKVEMNDAEHVNVNNNKIITETIDLATENDSSQDGSQRELVKLPENIPSDILDIINKLKRLAVDFKGESKKKFFNDDVNSCLLSLEKKCRILGKSSRLRVYEHLSFFIKVRRETLIRRAKSLIFEQEECKVLDMKRKLKDIIDKVMPILIANFDKENQKIVQLKYSKDAVNGEENKNVKLPRRKFQWNDDAKKLLKDIVTTKKKCFLLEGKQKTNLEELVVNFLVKEIIPLWPEGWMTINTLKKAFNSMTEHNSSKLHENSISTPTHSNLTIIPVVPKSTTVTTTTTTAPAKIKTEISNSVTVTKLTETTSNGNKKMPETSTSKTIEMTMSNPQMLKMMIDEFGKKVNHKDDVDHKKTTEVPKVKQNELFKPYSDKPSTKVENTKPWPSELFITPAEQPKDYSKHRHLDGKHDYAKINKKDERHLLGTVEPSTKSSKSDGFNSNCSLPDPVKHWHQDLLHSPKHKSNDHIESPKTHMRHNEHSSPSKHSAPAKVHSKSNEVPKPSTGVSDFKHISDLLKLPTESPSSSTPSSASSSKHKSSKEGGSKHSTDSSVIVVNSHQKDNIPKDSDLSSVIPKSMHCQLFDYDARSSKDESRNFKYAKDLPKTDLFSDNTFPGTSSFYPKYPDFASTTNFMPSTSSKISESEGYDIQKVMENLQALQKLSCSPIKNNISTSSPVSVIAYNSNKNSSNSKSGQSQNKNDFAAFQDDFQKQFINSLQQMAANPPPSSKSNYRCS